MIRFTLQLERGASPHTHSCPSCKMEWNCKRGACQTAPATPEGLGPFHIRELACLNCVRNAEPRLDGPCLAGFEHRNRHVVYRMPDGGDVCIACAARLGARLKRWCITAAPMECPTCGSTKTDPGYLICRVCPPAADRTEWPGRKLKLLRMLLEVGQ